MKKFFKKEKNFKKENSKPNLDLYWGIAVLFMFVTTLVSFAFGYYLFRQINKESAIETSGRNQQVESIRKERIDKVLQYFSKREERSNEILNSSSPIVDPSL